MKWWLVALLCVCVAFVAVVLPRFGWGAASQQRRQARADAEQVASTVCEASGCEIHQRGPFAADATLAKATTFWRIRIDRAGRPDLCFQLTPDLFRATSPRLKQPGVFHATSRHSFTGIAKAPCRSLGFG
jgi:hypothetical protein